MRRLSMFAVSLALAAQAPAALAQTMFKCVGVDGKTSYSDLPCAGKVIAKKELDVRANLVDVERENRRKAEKFERERDAEANRARAGEADNSEQAKRAEREARLMEGSELDRRLSEYEQVKADTQKRVKADEEARAEASRLWNCRRGPEPEKCQ